VKDNDVCEFLIVEKRVLACKFMLQANPGNIIAAPCSLDSSCAAHLDKRYCDVRNRNVKGGIDRKVYLAGPFFNTEQLYVAGKVEDICKKNNVKFFSPRLECFCPPNASRHQRAKTFNMNIEHIEKAEFVFARIDDFDPGTIWEIGYAFAVKVPIFAYTTVPDRGLNLMLVESGVTLVRGWGDIEKFLKGDLSVAKTWEGNIV